ncbi:MAG: hypothetical protein IBJ03_02485 [Gemmatimonadaceae bacterium]|nr:hypothetical protein [Gemmatimonadaceae bacterium]
MSGSIRIILALLTGLVVGGVVNMGLVMLGPSLIPPPPGVDMTTTEGLQASMSLLEPRHFIMPFLAHAVGTLVGAMVGALIAIERRAFVAYAIGLVFLCGGVAACFMIPAPMWFMVLDLLAAYIPMAWIGLSLAYRIKPASA